MEDFKIITPPSSPTFSVSGNNENLSESKRNSEQRSKKPFMAPTISTASKSITPNKKKILAEWKPLKMGTIPNSTTPNKSLSKIPSFFSEDETFIPDSTTIPYDPLTNYLSPRPKFLRYNPNRKRKLVFRREAESGSTSTISSTTSVTVSPKRVSLDSQSSCNVVETEGNLDQEIAEEEEEEEEAVGLKWVLCNWLFVIFGLVFCIIYISSMNKSAAINPEKIEFQDFGNLTFGIVSLRSLDSGIWVSEFDAKSEIVGKIEENQVPFSLEEGNLNSEFNSEIDYDEIFRDLDDFKQEIGEFNDFFPETIVEIEAPIVAESNFEGDEVKFFVIDAPSAAPEPNLVIQEEKLVDFEEKIHDLAAKEVEIVGDTHEIDGIKELNIVEIDEKQVRLTKLDYIWLVGLTVAAYVGCIVVLFFRKCKKAFTKTSPTKMKRNSSKVVREESDRRFRADSQLKFDIESRKERQKTPPRRILTAKPLGEVDFGGYFSGSLTMQQREGSVFSVPDERRAKKSKVSSPTSESAKQEDGKEEGTALRRSQRLQRLQNKGVASP